MGVIVWRHKTEFLTPPIRITDFKHHSCFNIDISTYDTHN